MSKNHHWNQQVGPVVVPQGRLFFPSCCRNISISPACLCITCAHARRRWRSRSELCCIVNEGGHQGTSPRRRRRRRRGGTNYKGFPARLTTHEFTDTALTKQEAGSSLGIVQVRRALLKVRRIREAPQTRQMTGRGTN